MPKGVPLPNMMDNDIVSGLYHAVKAAGGINYDQLMQAYGSKDKVTAKRRLDAILKSQAKGLDTATSTPATGVSVSKGRKRKAKVEEDGTAKKKMKGDNSDVKAENSQDEGIKADAA